MKWRATSRPSGETDSQRTLVCSSSSPCCGLVWWPASARSDSVEQCTPREPTIVYYCICMQVKFHIQRVTLDITHLFIMWHFKTNMILNIQHETLVFMK